MANSTKDIFMVLLRDLTKRLQSLDEREFEEILTGAAQFDIKITSRRTKTGKVKKALLTNLDMQRIMHTLEKMESRTEGSKYLKETCRGKEELKKLAKYIDIPVDKIDKIDQIIDRIVEATIGFRVRSAAIQGVKK
jgi:hypothetical protein